jgi:hypothetical protein
LSRQNLDSISKCFKVEAVTPIFSFEAIDENLKQLGAGIPESVMYVLESEAQEDPEAILDGSTLQKMLSSNNDTTIDSLPSGDEEQEDTEVTESGIQKAGDKGLLALPVSSNDCALALSVQLA